MKRKHLYWLMVFVGFGVYILGCGSPKLVVSYRQTAEEQAASGNYIQAVEAWKMHFAQQGIENVQGNEFAEAARTAWKAGDHTQAVAWYDQARYKQFSSEEMYSTLANIFHKSDNLSKEMDALEYYVQNFTLQTDSVYGRLYGIYVETGNTDKAKDAWMKMDNRSRDRLENLESWFRINKNLGDTALCDSVSLIILEKDPVHVSSLEWNAQKYYQRAENRYQREMEVYNKNKTNRQYRILLNELDLVTADFKKSLEYFDRLWAIQPGKKYAGYLSNIYARFGDEKKSLEYRKILEEK